MDEELWGQRRFVVSPAVIKEGRCEPLQGSRPIVAAIPDGKSGPLFKFFRRQIQVVVGDFPAGGFSSPEK